MFTRRLGVIVFLAGVIGAVAAAVPSSHGAAAQLPNLVVHEWGTFTSIAGADGQAIQWRPLTGPSDLPCFVTQLNPNSIKLERGGLSTLKATVRMETPVLYFYSPSDQTVRATVRFPQGLISEWYPQATQRPGSANSTGPTNFNTLERIQWDNVHVTPGVKKDFPTEPDGSHYYAARETDAAAVTVGDQNEKFLFYRGIANFRPPLSATIDRDGRVAVAQPSGTGVDTLILFERRDGRMGYRVAHAEGKNIILDRPKLADNVESLREGLRGILAGEGLYPREAAAMVETWRDSWFEDGARLFYVLPQSAVDAILPLQIEPRPATVKRVFVGRMEIVTPEIESEVVEAVRTSNQPVLRKYGRFLEPISQMVQQRLAGGYDQQKADDAMKLVAAKATKTACSAPGSPRPSGPASNQ
jgi:hypothetical protein